MDTWQAFAGLVDAGRLGEAFEFFSSHTEFFVGASVINGRVLMLHAGSDSLSPTFITFRGDVGVIVLRYLLGLYCGANSSTDDRIAIIDRLHDAMGEMSGSDAADAENTVANPRYFLTVGRAVLDVHQAFTAAGAAGEGTVNPGGAIEHLVSLLRLARAA